MRYENKKWVRDGRFFINQAATLNLQDVRILHSGVDTVKELFQCLLKPEVLENISHCYDSDFDSMYSAGDVDFIISKSSKKSGYQWILKNADLGIVVLLKSFYLDIGLHGSHIKIECSPHLIASKTPEQLSEFTLKIARIFADQVQAVACSAHLAVDVKGWEVPKDFEYALVTRAKRKMSFAGISNMSVDLAETAAIYGDRQTYTFGSASSVQLCVYDKVTEAIKSDKICYWEEVWRQIPSVTDIMIPEYQQGDKVIRIEGRLHHTVIQQFCWGTKGEDGKNINIRNFADLSKYLTALWRYVLNNFRLQYSSSYIHPFWQMLEEDVIFYAPSPAFDFRRGQKEANDNVKRKVGIWLGNTVRLYSRKRFKVSVIVDLILKTGLESELRHYFGLFGEDSDALQPVLFDFVQHKVKLLTLQGIAS